MDTEKNRALAITIFDGLCRHPSLNYWGTTVTDSFFPTVSTWDTESDTQWEIICAVDEENRADAIKRLLMYVREEYRHGSYPAGVTPFICGYDLKMQEIEFMPTEDDIEMAERAQQRRDIELEAHIADMKERGLWRLNDKTEG